jgi:hypothetical protein
LRDDPELRKLAIEHGFRNTETAYFRDWTGRHNLAIPETIVNVVEPPSYEILETMIQRIERQY